MGHFPRGESDDDEWPPLPNNSTSPRMPPQTLLRQRLVESKSNFVITIHEWDGDGDRDCDQDDHDCRDWDRDPRDRDYDC